MDWIKNNIIAVLAVVISLSGSYATFRVQNADMLRDIQEIQEEVQEMDEEFESWLSDDDERLDDLTTRVSVIESKLP